MTARSREEAIRWGDRSLHGGDWQAARSAYERALFLAPRHPAAALRLASLSRLEGKFDLALHHYNGVLENCPGNANALIGMAGVFIAQGRIPEAQAAAELVLESDSNHWQAASTWFVALHYRSDLTARDIGQAAHWLRKRFSLQKDGIPPGPKREVCSGPLRVGYLSPDFREHSVACFLRPVIEAHDRTRFIWFAYSLSRFADKATAAFRKSFDHWRDLEPEKVGAAVDIIRRDRLDVLVDLAGHFGSVNPAIFSHCPGPIQTHYLGFCGTTGITGMNYRFSDPVADPETCSDEETSTETIIRLPRGFHAYRPLIETPEPTSPPRQKNGFLTFGSFNAYPKLNDDVIALWTALLRLAPSARLVLKCESFADPSVQNACLRRFAKHGIGADQIRLQPPVFAYAGHFGSYSDIDVALDPFPYNGVTTTCDALWQGVPVATLAGERHSGRVGASLLRQAGLETWVFSDRDAFLTGLLECIREPDLHLPDRRSLSARFRERQRTRAPELARDLEDSYERLSRSHRLGPPA